MRYFLLGAITCLPLLYCQPSVAQQKNLSASHVANEELKEKLYRQALFYYFSGDNEKALLQVDINNERFNANTAKSDLFNAGLQVAIGLQQQASNNLDQLANTKQLTSSDGNNTSKELLTIALLQLSEQQIKLGEHKKAQQNLAKINYVTPAYYQQYYTLNQLAYWPISPTKLTEITTKALANENAIVDENKQPQESAYIKLNNALFYLQNKDYVAAENLLLSINRQPESNSHATFWQQLFNPFSIFTESNNVKTDEQLAQDNVIQQQAITDYAQLLLAQLYVEKHQYEQAFKLLQAFPQHSPYSEAALFLFAYSAQKTQRYDMATTLFELLQTQYPYSQLGWQSALLKASQITEQVMSTNNVEQASDNTQSTQTWRSLNLKLTAYTQASDFFEDKLNQLKQFEQNFMAQHNLLTFASISAPQNSVIEQNQITHASTNNESLITRLSSISAYQTTSPWLQKALLNPVLKKDYKKLLELKLLKQNVQQKQIRNQWINYTLARNKNRQRTLFSAEKQQLLATKINALILHKEQLEKQLKHVENTQNITSLANSQQLNWLSRIEKSKHAIAVISQQRDTKQYTKRLNRIHGVLMWQLNQQFPERVWQYKKQLKAINQQLNVALEQQKNVNLLASEHRSLSHIEQRLNNVTQQLDTVLNKIEQINESSNKNIKSTVQLFIEQQRQILTNNLLAARHAMAQTLEQMALIEQPLASGAQHD